MVAFVTKTAMHTTPDFFFATSPMHIIGDVLNVLKKGEIKMFGRDMDNIKAYLEKIDARFNDTEINGLRQIYVYDKEVYDLQKKHPRKYGNLYCSYIRISDHGGDGLYTRQDGICGEMTDENIKRWIDYLTNGIWVETEAEKEAREYLKEVDADCFID